MDKSSQFKLEITQDKLVDILMHAATREDIARLDAKMEAKFVATHEEIAKLDAKMEAKFVATHEEIAKLDAKMEAKFVATHEEIAKLDAKIDAKFEKMTWFLFGAVLVPTMVSIVMHFIK